MIHLVNEWWWIIIFWWWITIFWWWIWYMLIWRKWGLFKPTNRHLPVVFERNYGDLIWPRKMLRWWYHGDIMGIQIIQVSMELVSFLMFVWVHIAMFSAFEVPRCIVISCWEIRRFCMILLSFLVPYDIPQGYMFMTPECKCPRCARCFQNWPMFWWSGWIHRCPKFPLVGWLIEELV